MTKKKKSCDKGSDPIGRRGTKEWSNLRALAGEEWGAGGCGWWGASEGGGGLPAGILCGLSSAVIEDNCYSETH